MNPEEIQDLKRKNEELSSKVEELERKNSERDRQVEDLKKVLETHTHSGNDGSNYIYQDAVKQKTQQPYRIGNFEVNELSGVFSEGGILTYRGVLSVGVDESLQDGWDNVSLTIEHQPTTDGTLNNSFFYGYRGRLYSGAKGRIEEGGSTLTQKEFEIETDSLVGLLLNYTLSSGITESYEITANDKNTITVDGTWTTSQKEGKFFIFMPVYNGAAQYPWRRAYVMDTSNGGLRFGPGSTAAGQNGLLYSDGEDLFWRSPAGTTSQLN